jgi:DNA-binding PadR family transcriptional regulator
MIMDVKMRILMTLSEGPLPQSTIQLRSAKKESKITSPRIMKKALGILDEQKCIIFENKKTWRRGQKKIYKLTERGFGRLVEYLGKELPVVSDLFENFLMLVSSIEGNHSFRQRWQEWLYQSSREQDFVGIEHVYSSLDECVKKIHELKLDLGIISVIEPLRKHKGLPMIDAKMILDSSVLCFDHSAKGQGEDDLPFRYLPREGFKAMLGRASLREKGLAPWSSKVV